MNIRKIKRVNNYLIGLILILLALYIIALNSEVWTIFKEYSVKNISSIERLINIAKDLLHIIAIIIGCIWTYFHFIKSRTFKAKAQLKIKPYVISVNEKNRFISIRCSIENMGSTKITCRYFRFEIYRINIEDGEIKDILIKDEIDENLLTKSTITNLSYYIIEPNDELHRDVKLVLNKDIDIILIKIFLVSKRYDLWEECMPVNLKLKGG